MRTILVTGAAGFIGFHTAQHLLQRGDRVVGIDNLNDYYDVGLKRARVSMLEEHAGFTLLERDITEPGVVSATLREHSIRDVVHLAAQVGVRASAERPADYVDSNVAGFLQVLEACRHNQVRHLVYASSSSVYGNGTQSPYTVKARVDHPISLYAATKRANELFAHAYSHSYGLPTTGLRFFTVYGPWGRPDMALFRFAEAIAKGDPIDVYNRGDMKRDFTFVDDVVEAIVTVLDSAAEPNAFWSGDNPDPSSSEAPFRLYNVGNGSPRPLLDAIEALEEAMGRKAAKNFLPMQQGDMKETHADVSCLETATGFSPATDLRAGIRKFVEWYSVYSGYESARSR